MPVFISKSIQDTESISKTLAKWLCPGDIICLTGQLGSGKTCFSKGLINGLNVSEKYISSPSFTIINEYTGKYPVYHFDIYRLHDEIELEALGYEEYFYGKGITIIEWADKMKKLMPEDRLDIYFSYINETSRRIVFKPVGKNWTNREIGKKIKSELYR